MSNQIKQSNVSDQDIKDMVARLYKDETGKPIMLKKSQIKIFRAIALRESPRLHIMCHTRYGKSLTVALAVLTRAATFPEKWAIVSGTKEKAKIIMGYINAHIFDNEFIIRRFQLDKGETSDFVRRHRTKSHVTFNVGNNLMGEIFICSAKEAIGHGAKNIVEDEASLIPDDEHSLVMRMLGDDPTDNFLCKIGNPFERNHFLKSYTDPNYEKIEVDCYQSLEEGRMTKETIEENKVYSFFGVLYECKFPDAEAVDQEGWSYLFTENDLKKTYERFAVETERFGRKRLGVDVARGGRNYNAIVLRQGKHATVLRKWLDNDLMSVTGIVQQYMQEHHVIDKDVIIDDVGVGGGVTDRLRELGYNVLACKEGAKATEMTKKWNPKTKKEEDMPDFVNMKAQLYAGKKGVAVWLRQEGVLEPSEDWNDMLRIKFKRRSDNLTFIEPKADMRKRGEESPDVADALMLTFYDEDQPETFHNPDPTALLNQGVSYL